MPGALNTYKGVILLVTLEGVDGNKRSIPQRLSKACPRDILILHEALIPNMVVTAGSDSRIRINEKHLDLPLRKDFIQMIPVGSSQTCLVA